MSSESMECFLKRAKGFLDHGNLGKFNHHNVQLCEYSYKGEKPCENCPREKYCTNSKCLAYYAWIRFKWKKIQKAAGVST